MKTTNEDINILVINMKNNLSKQHQTLNKKP